MAVTIGRRSLQILAAVLCTYTSLYGGSSGSGPSTSSVTEDDILSGFLLQESGTDKAHLPTTSTLTAAAIVNSTESSAIFTESSVNSTESSVRQNLESLCGNSSSANLDSDQVPGLSGAGLGSSERTSVCVDDGSETVSPRTDGTTGVDSSTEEDSSPPRLLDSGMMSRAAYYATKRGLHYVLLPMTAFGALVNAFNMAVFVQPAMRSASSSYLASICLANTLFLLAFLLELILNFIYSPRAHLSLVYLVAVVQISMNIEVILRRIVFALTLVVSFERFVAVTFPFKYRQLRLSRHPVRISILVSVLIALSRLTALKYEVFRTSDGAYDFRIRQVFANYETFFVRWSTVFRSLLVYVPLAACLILNVLTALVLRRHRTRARSLTTNQSSAENARLESQATVAIIVSILVFVLLSLPVHVLSVLHYYHSTFGWRKKEHYLFLLANRLCSALEVLSNFIDLLVFMTLSQGFRTTFYRLYCRRCCPSLPDQTKPARTRTTGKTGVRVEMGDESTDQTASQDLSEMP